MAIILNIDTAVETASICLAKNGEPLQELTNARQRDHAAWLHTAVKQVLAGQAVDRKMLEAVAVTIGPGSYTGLRVGLSAAKGFCFALNVPLIAITTLEMMRCAVKKEEARFYCPMIDARRMEVFTAVYSAEMELLMPPSALVLEERIFDEWLNAGTMLFSGNGSNKWKELTTHPNARFSSAQATAANMTRLTEERFIANNTANLAYTEPLYIKEFYSPAR